MMDELIAATLLDPDTVTAQTKNNTWKYTKKVELWETGFGYIPSKKGEATIVVVWGLPDYNIITAYPQKIKAL